MIGTRFGSVVVLNADKSKRRSYFICKCDCGMTKSIYGYHLKRGKIKSCGCKGAKAVGKNNPTYNGYEDISGVYWSKIKEGAKHRGLAFKLTKKYAWDLFIEQNRRCALSGVVLKFNSSFHVRDGTASLDRIDSSKGYVVGNVQWVHKIVNKLKSNLSDEIVIEWSKIIANYNKRKS